VKFYITFIFSFLLVFLPLPIYNYIVDWYGVFQEHDEKGFVYTKNPKRGMNRANLPYLRITSVINYMSTTDNVVLLIGSSPFGILSDSYTSKKLGYNFIKASYPAGTLPEHLHNLKVLIKKGLIPKAVVVGVDDFSINNQIVHKEFNRRLYPLGIIDTFDFWSEQLFRQPKVSELKVALYGNYNKVNIKASPHNYWKPKKTLLTSKHEKKMLHLMAHKVGADTKNNINAIISNVKDLKKLSKQYNFKLIFFYTPRWATTYLYRNHEQIHQFKKELAKHVDFFDFSGLTKNNMEHHLWRETSHYTTELSNLIIDTIIDNKSQAGIWGRKITSENISRHLTELKQDIYDNADHWLQKKPDTEVYPVLYSWLNSNSAPKEQKTWEALSYNTNEWHPISKKNNGRWSKKKIVTITIPPQKNIDRIVFQITGAPTSFYNKKRKNRKMILKVNNNHYGSAIFGKGKGLSNKKTITILGDFSNKTNITFILHNLYKQSKKIKPKTDRKKYGFLLKNEFTTLNK